MELRRQFTILHLPFIPLFFFFLIPWRAAQSQEALGDGFPSDSAVTLLGIGSCGASPRSVFHVGMEKCRVDVGITALFLPGQQMASELQERRRSLGP